MKTCLIFLFSLFCLLSCKQKEVTNDLDEFANEYLKLGLIIGQFEPGFVDAYYGPDSLKPKLNLKPVFRKDSLLSAINSLNERLEKFKLDSNIDSTDLIRARWLGKQLNAFKLLVRNISGERVDFDEESLQFFTVKAPIYDEQHYQSLVKEIDKLLPGVGTPQERYQMLLKKFMVPPDKIETVFTVAINEARRKTLEHLNLPKEEEMKIEFVHGLQWEATNSYQGNYASLMQVNLDYPISIFDALNLASHEGYPGHHTHFVMVEKTNVRNKGWLEHTLIALPSPQTFLAEAVAENGIEMIFPGNNLKKFLQEILLPLAELDTTGIDAFYKASLLLQKLNYAKNETFRGFVNNTMSIDKIIEWQVNYLFRSKEIATKRANFLKPGYGFSYDIGYNYGEDLVKSYLEANSLPNNENSRWNTFNHLLCADIIPFDLIPK